ncbi:MAG: hypothetical protein HY279_08505 [Nitrospinae bacterium]|nr:hypothetical protein [Nitrospinota bacterium]
MKAALKLVSMFVILSSLLWVSCSKPAEKGGGSAEGMAGFMPDISAGSEWKSEGGIKCYKGEELFNYIDGGAELFHDYGFKKACVRDYQKIRSEDLSYNYTVEIYEMENSQKAFGVYSINREGEHPQLGQEAAYQEGFLNIWKGRYYIRIFTPQKGTDIQKDILFLGEKAVSQIKDTGEMPYLLKYVPTSAVKDKTVSFYQMGPLNNIFFLSHENILNLTGEEEGITFLLPVVKENVRIIIIRYPDFSRAKESMENVAKGYFSQPPSSTGTDEYRGKKKDKAAITKIHKVFLILAVGGDEKAVHNAVLESLKPLK